MVPESSITLAPRPFALFSEGTDAKNKVKSVGSLEHGDTSPHISFPTNLAVLPARFLCTSVNTRALSASACCEFIRRPGMKGAKAKPCKRACILQAVTRVCGLLKLHMFEDGELIFARYSEAKGMYITCAGTYLQSLGGKDSKFSHESFEFYAEISLFMKFSHAMSLFSISFNDVFFLDPMQLADSLKDFAESWSRLGNM